MGLCVVLSGVVCVVWCIALPVRCDNKIYSLFEFMLVSEPCCEAFSRLESFIVVSGMPCSGADGSSCGTSCIPKCSLVRHDCIPVRHAYIPDCIPVRKD